MNIWEMEERGMMDWAESATSAREHARTMDKLTKAVEIAKAFSIDTEVHDFEMDIHVDRYGDTKIKVVVNRRGDRERPAT